MVKPLCNVHHEISKYWAQSCKKTTDIPCLNQILTPLLVDPVTCRQPEDQTLTYVSKCVPSDIL